MNATIRPDVQFARNMARQAAATLNAAVSHTKYASAQAQQFLNPLQQISVPQPVRPAVHVLKR